MILTQLLATIGTPNAEHISNRLLETFGTLHGVFAATTEAVNQAAGASVAALLAIAREAVEASLRERVLRSRCEVESLVFREYVRSRVQCMREEVLLVVFLDRGMHFIADELVGQGGIDALTISGRVLFRRALELNATGLILAHNHPSGTASPSEIDVTATRRLESAAAALDINLVDHLVVGSGQIVSMRLGGLLN